MLVGEYAEVADAIHSRTPGSDTGGQRQSRVITAERTLEETTNKADQGAVLVLPSTRNQRNKPPPLQLQLPHQSLIQIKAAEFRARSEVLTANPLKAGGANPLINEGMASSSTDHVYDSVDAISTPTTTTPEAAKVLGAEAGASSSKYPPIYHVLEGPTPTPDSVSEQSTPTSINPQPSVPPKPPRSRQRIQSCASFDENDHKSVQSQLRSVMVIYEGMPERERSASSLLFPPNVTRGAVRDSESQPSTAKNMQKFAGKEQQAIKKTVKANSTNSSQVCFQKNGADSTVYKTKEHDFQSELPKIPQRMSSEMLKENKRPKQLSKKTKAGGDSTNDEEGHYYAQPFTKNRKYSAECQLFDDPAYYAQSCGGSQKLASSTDSATETQTFDNPSYAMPSPKSKPDITQSADNLFDDPKYNSPGAAADSHSLRVRFDDSKYSQNQGRNVLRRHLLDRDRKGVCHSSSVDHFSGSSGSEYPDELRGNSLTNVADELSSRVHGLKVTNL